MCTIALLLGVADLPLIIAANRDELYARPTRPPELLGPGLVGGVDELSGGTWLALHRDGRFAAVTNQRALDTPPPGLRSRGLAVKELAAAEDQSAYVAALDPHAYASMNLVWGDADHVSIAYCRQPSGDKAIVALEPGIHVLCNDRLGTPGFPRGERLELAIRASLADSKQWAHLTRDIVAALGDHTKLALDEVRTTGGLASAHLPPELARELTATCIHSEYYGTRSASLIAIESGRIAHFLHADGPPCTVAFEDGRDLFE